MCTFISAKYSSMHVDSERGGKSRRTRSKIHPTTGRATRKLQIYSWRQGRDRTDNLLHTRREGVIILPPGRPKKAFVRKMWIAARAEVTSLAHVDTSLNGILNHACDWQGILHGCSEPPV